MKNLLYYIFILLFSACAIKSSHHKNKKGVKIKWVENMVGNFSFKKNWSYPEGVYKNEFNQLSCDGLCPPEIDRMKNNTGKIIKDSLTSFYKFIDTSHRPHTFKSTAWCYEWAGTNYIEVTRNYKDTVTCYSHVNAATHCRLVLKITDARCYVSIELKSIS
jgi:hypothetical protein